MKKLYNYSQFFLYSATFIIMVIILSSWWYFVYSSVGVKIKYYKSFVSRVNKQKQNFLQAHEEIDMLKKDFARLENYYKSLHNTCTVNNGVVECKPLIFVIKAIANNNLILESYKPLKEIDKKEYKVVLFEFALKGDFFDYLNFFKNLHRSHFMIKIKKCILQYSDNDLLCSGIIAIKSMKNYEEINTDDLSLSS